MQKIYLLNVTLAILILALSFFTGTLLAQTPGSVFHRAEEIKSGIFGSDLNETDTYTFPGWVTLDGVGAKLKVGASKISSTGLTVNGSSLVVDPTTGNVGIGTTGPNAKLHVSGGDIEESDGSNGFLMHPRHGTGYDFWQLTPKTGGSYEWGKGITLVRSTGNVGIGTTTPGEKLEVNGNIKLSGSTPTYKITNLALPSVTSDAATKGYVDAQIGSSTWGCGDDITFTYNGIAVTYGTVLGANNKCWLDRNLGAQRVATAYNDIHAYGDLFQWGRCADGHQLRTSSTYAGPVGSATCPVSSQGWYGKFVTTSAYPYDWITPQDNTLWQGVNGINNPCPSGWRIPTETEWNTERLSWSSDNSAGAFASPLKLTAGGYRNLSSGSLGSVGSYGSYWSSTVSGTDARLLYFGSTAADMYSSYRADGFSVRCVKD